MNKEVLWVWLLKNVMMMLLWTLIAIVFNKWWIILFALLFMSSVETKHKSYRVCDGCGKHSPYANSHNESLDKAKAEGWTHIADTNKDYCPQCRWAGMDK